MCLYNATIILLLLLCCFFKLYSTLKDRAVRLMKTKGVPLESLPSSLFQKTKNVSVTDFNDSQKQIAYLEAQVYRCADVLLVSIMYIYLYIYVRTCIKPLSSIHAHI